MADVDTDQVEIEFDEYIHDNGILKQAYLLDVYVSDEGEVRCELNYAFDGHIIHTDTYKRTEDGKAWVQLNIDG